MPKWNRFQRKSEMIRWKIFYNSTLPQSAEDVWKKLFDGSDEERLNSSIRRICCLCGRRTSSPTALTNSHFIPHSLLKRVGQDIPTVTVDLRAEEDASCTVSTMWTRKLLCGYCDGLFADKIETHVDSIKIGKVLCFPQAKGCREGENSWTKSFARNVKVAGNHDVCEKGRIMFWSIMYRSLLKHIMDNGTGDLLILNALHCFFHELLVKDNNIVSCSVPFAVLYDVPVDIRIGTASDFEYDANFRTLQYTARFWTTYVCSHTIKIGHILIIFRTVMEVDQFRYICAPKRVGWGQYVGKLMKACMTDRRS